MSNYYVFDTNVIVSALLFAQSIPRQAFDAALDGGRILISQAVVEELNEVLSRKKFERYVPQEKRTRFLVALFRKAIFVEILEKIQECRDPKDDKFLELAVNGDATAIISGDKDLLALNFFRGISIMTPSQFLQQIAIE